LEELCIFDYLDKYEEETGGDNVRINYIILKPAEMRWMIIKDLLMSRKYLDQLMIFLRVSRPWKFDDMI
jgi:hypothetical protein